MTNEMMLPYSGELEILEPGFDAVAGIVGALFGGMALFSLLIGAVFYVLQGLGLYTIAKRRGIHKAWMAWVPVVNLWILGSISDQYQYVAKGSVKNRRKALLILELLMLVLIGVCMGSMVGAITQYIAMADAPELMTGGAVGAILGGTFAGLVGAVLSVVAMVIYYIACYDVFRSCCPDTAVVFLLLGVFFYFLIPIFLFVSRNKDEGMPPRKQTPPEDPSELL